MGKSVDHFVVAKATACLRRLAARVAEIAALPEQAEKRRAVMALDRLEPVPPRIYCFPEGAWLECIPPESLECEDPLLRGWETRLRMAIYTHEVLRVLTALEEGGYLGLNNGCDWIHTGGIGYTDELPAPGYDARRVRCRDLWGGVETQDLVGISPAMFEELILPHVRPIVERFGLGSCGCCEPLHDWIPALKSIRNLRRVSISPWADVRLSAERLGNRYVLSRKPLPTPLATQHFDDASILESLRADFRIIREHDCRAEVVAKDLHTVQHEPRRLQRWVALARQARAEIYR